MGAFDTFVFCNTVCLIVPEHAGLCCDVRPDWRSGLHPFVIWASGDQMRLCIAFCATVAEQVMVCRDALHTWRGVLKLGHLCMHNKSPAARHA